MKLFLIEIAEWLKVWSSHEDLFGMFFERNTSKKEQLKIGDELDELCDFLERKMRNHSPLQFLKTS